MSDVEAGSDGSASAGTRRWRGAGDLFGSFALSYLVGALLLGTLIHFGGAWYIAAYTRVLDLLITGGIVQLHDSHPGFIEGVPDLQLFLYSQEPIDIRLLVLTGFVFLVFWGLKSSQFHLTSLYCGIDGSFGQHARAYLYGTGLNRLLPYNFGNVATASALQGQGAPLERAAQVVFLGELFTIFEIVVFALLGLWLVGWTTWLSMLFWPCVILLAAYLWVRPRRRGDPPPEGDGFWTQARAAGRALAQQPMRGFQLAMLSIVAFALEDLAVFIVMMALTTDIVILTIDTNVILMGVVGGYIARLIPVSPGGIGQFEWGFAAACLAAGADLPGVATVILADTFVRYVTGSLVLGGVTLGYGVETNWRRTLALFRSTPELEPQPQPVISG